MKLAQKHIKYSAIFVTMFLLLLKKIIKAGVGRTRFIMATTGLFIALFLILLALQTQINFNDLLYGKYNENETADFLVVNKEITNSNIGQKDSTVFSQAEIDAVKKQGFTDSVGVVSVANFSIQVESFSEKIPFYSEIFFESVPDEFIDLKSKNWGWQQGSNQVPIIIPSFFLDLYNSGMAMSREELPQLSLDVLMAVPIKITVQGNGKNQEFVGHVVGLSDRINSILIPQAFMNFANANFGYKQAQKPNRIVLKTNDPSNPDLVKYLEKNNWKTNTDKTRFSKVRKIVNWIVGILGAIGIIMLLFGLLVFSLFIQITIASCKTEIELLKDLGTAPIKLQSFLMKQFFPIAIIITVIVLAIISVLQFTACSFLKPQNMFISNFISPITLIAAIIMLIVIWFTNKKTINKYLS